MTPAPWWKQAAFYHIYPLSFQDTTGNGMGDLAGILQRLDYLRELGVDALWISPCFPSPMADWGYDVSHYHDIPAQHSWFVQSRRSRDDPKRDWYIWRDPGPGGGPPNNWLSYFGGPAWDLDPTTGQYYMRSFLKEKPDLNWRNPKGRRARGAG